MKYTVVWRPTAEGKLTSIWTSADDRPLVTRAADDIDAMLAASPQDVGESREGNTRILAVYPLCVHYDVHEADRLVAVWAVWRTRKRPPAST
jgi:hypothetical protein